MHHFSLPLPRHPTFLTTRSLSPASFVAAEFLCIQTHPSRDQLTAHTHTQTHTANVHSSFQPCSCQIRIDAFRSKASAKSTAKALCGRSVCERGRRGHFMPKGWMHHWEWTDAFCRIHNDSLSSLHMCVQRQGSTFDSVTEGQNV